MLTAPDQFRPGNPCPEPDCPGHLAAYLGYEVCCLWCFWIPEDGVRFASGHEALAWLRRCRTESVVPWTPPSRAFKAA